MPMPSYKEKKRAFLELKNEKCVEADLDLLLSRYALCPRAYIINPRRHADAILFTLLDIVPSEEIIHHRADFYRPIVPANDSDNEPKDELNNEPKDELDNKPKDELDNEPKTEPVNEGNAEKAETHKERADKAEKRANEAEKRANEAENRAEEAEERADEAEEALEEAEDRATAAENALKEEKKKE